MNLSCPKHKEEYRYLCEACRKLMRYKYAILPMTEKQKREIIKQVQLGKDVHLPEGFSIETLYYNISITTGEQELWLRKIRQGETLPDVLGLLMGRAEPVQVIKTPADKKE